jgi:hypothetical protein
MSSLQWNHGQREILRAGGALLGMEVYYLRRGIRSPDLGESRPLPKVGTDGSQRELQGQKGEKVNRHDDPGRRRNPEVPANREYFRDQEDYESVRSVALYGWINADHDGKEESGQPIREDSPDEIPGLILS